MYTYYIKKEVKSFKCLQIAQNILKIWMSIKFWPPSKLNNEAFLLLGNTKIYKTKSYIRQLNNFNSEKLLKYQLFEFFC